MLKKKYNFLFSLFEILYIKNRYQRNIKAIRNSSVKNKIIVAFFITQKQLWSSQSIYDALLVNDNFDPILIAFPDGENTVDLPGISCEDNYQYFYNKKMKVLKGFCVNKNKFVDHNEINADIIFYDQPHPFLPKHLLWRRMSKRSLVCYVPYGFKIANFYEAHFNMSLQNCSWAVFAESDWHKKQFRKYGLRNGENVVVSGYPKLDYYNCKRKSNLDEKAYKKTIIWAPHWSILDKLSSSSTFHRNYEYFLNLAKSNNEIYWIFKPHQKLIHYCEEIGFMSGEEILDYYNEWDNLPNAEYYDGSDYFSLFLDSDALITDCGSFLAEYLPSKKPILLLVNEKSVGYNEIGQKLVDSYYKARINSDIENFVSSVVLGEDDFLEEERMKNYELVMPNSNGAGEFIATFFESNLVI
jgi:hypothetical protein